MQLDSGVEVAFTDKRRFARVRLLDDVCSLEQVNIIFVLSFIFVSKYCRICCMVTI